MEYCHNMVEKSVQWTMDQFPYHMEKGVVVAVLVLDNFLGEIIYYHFRGVMNFTDLELHPTHYSFIYYSIIKCMTFEVFIIFF